MTEAQYKANKKHLEKLEDIKIRVPKGKREIYKQQAERQEMSLNAYIISLIEKDMEQD